MTVRGFYEETKPLSDKEMEQAEFIGRMFTAGKTLQENKLFNLVILFGQSLYETSLGKLILGSNWFLSLE